MRTPPRSPISYVSVFTRGAVAALLASTVSCAVDALTRPSPADFPDVDPTLVLVLTDTARRGGSDGPGTWAAATDAARATDAASPVTIVATVDLGSLPGGEASGSAAAVNNAGQVVGRSGGRAFVWDADCGMRELYLPGDDAGVADINAPGRVLATVCIAKDEAGVNCVRRQALLWDDGRIRDLFSGEANALNAAGSVAGTVNGRAVRWTPATGPIDLPDGEEPGSHAEGINAAGDVVGASGVVISCLYPAGIGEITDVW